ncbi:MAG: hypothetical protein L0Z49_14510, partial [Actinobacteria bacterium]|nr:hypothetical protein [Actinomycetota bacterium]
DIAGQIDRVRQAVAEAGKDPGSFEITASGAKVDALDTLHDAGVDRVVFNLPSQGTEVVIPRLDMLAGSIG